MQSSLCIVLQTVACGYGHQQRDVTCVHIDGTAVDKELCSPDQLLSYQVGSILSPIQVWFLLLLSENVLWTKKTPDGVESWGACNPDNFIFKTRKKVTFSTTYMECSLKLSHEEVSLYHDLWIIETSSNSQDEDIVMWDVQKNSYVCQKIAERK